MKAMYRILLISGLLLATGPAIAQASKPVTSEDETVYNTLYGKKLAAAKRTRSTDDDKVLASEMMAFAQEIPNDTGVQCLIYIDTIRLASGSAEIKMMREAAALLESLWPGHEAANPEALIDKANRAYRAASRSERKQVGEGYIDLLMHAAEQAQHAQDLDKATSLSRQANSVARAINSPRRADIQKAIDHLAEESALISRVKRLKISVSKNPQNVPAARELVDLLLTKRDDPVAAAKYVASTQDDNLIEIVQLCAKGFEEADPMDAMRVADWYLSLAEDENDRYAESLLRNTIDWYTRFIEAYERRDALAKRVQTQREQAQERLNRIAQAQGGTLEGGWVDLIKHAFKPDLHTLGKPVNVIGSEVTIEQSSIVLPVELRGTYEMRTSFTIQRGNEDSKSAFIIHLPAGRAAATLRYDWRGELVAWLDETEERYSVDGRKDGLNKVTQLIFHVAVLDQGNVELALIIGGNKVLQWRGPANELNHDKRVAPPAELGPAIRITCPSKTTFHKLELRVPKD